MSSHQCYVYQKDFEQNVIQGPAVLCLMQKAWQKAVYNLIYMTF